MRYTEACHPLTSKLDQLDLNVQIQCLADVDRELFGSTWGDGLMDLRVIAKIEQVQKDIQEVLRHPNGKVVLSGAGTSGRIAYYMANSLDNSKLVGFIAGGPEAFFRAKERIEDLPEQGRLDLEPILEQPGPVLYIGITCGLSAAYVAGQIEACRSHSNAQSVLLGFNPQEEANARHLDSIGCSFKELIQTETQAGRCTLVNPVIGPEPVTGSTRMKGGTATLLLLYLMLEPLPVKATLDKMCDLQKTWHANGAELTAIIGAAKLSLSSGGSLTYLADEASGFLAFLDASECPPTYSAEEKDVRALVPGTFMERFPELCLTGRTYQDFQAEHVSTWLRTCDLDKLPALGDLKIHHLPPVDVSSFDDPRARRCAFELAIKWYLNTISSLAFVQLGKVIGNRMVDLRISNLKLMDRAVRILVDVSGQPEAVCRERLFGEIKARADRPVEGIEELIEVAVGERGLVAYVARMLLSEQSEEIPS